MEMITSIVITTIVILPHNKWFNYHRVSSLRGGHFRRPVKEITIAKKDKERKYIHWKLSSHFVMSLLEVEKDLR